MASAIYTRVSTDEQADSGHGIKAQMDACLAVLPGADTFTDAGVSGAAGLDKRPGLLAAIATLRKGDVLLVAKRDRLARDPLVMAMIESAVKRKGARIQSAAGEGTEGDDPASVMMRRMIDAFAEYERLVIGARTKAALQAKRKRSERVGSIPYGYRLDTDGIHLMEDQAEQEAIRKIQILRDGGMSLRAIVAELDARGYQARGNRWHVSTIVRILEAAA
jgi:DNA invertase Pin-like site-specific DNA recombinase